MHAVGVALLPGSRPSLGLQCPSPSKAPTSVRCQFRGCWTAGCLQIPELRCHTVKQSKQILKELSPASGRRLFETALILFCGQMRSEEKVQSPVSRSCNGSASNV